MINHDGFWGTPMAMETTISEDPNLGMLHQSVVPLLRNFLGAPFTEIQTPGEEGGKNGCSQHFLKTKK